MTESNAPNGSLWLTGAASTGSYSSVGSTTFTATTATDPSAAWAVNQWAGRRVTAGANYGWVLSNTATVLTILAWVGSTPSAATAFTIAGPGGRDHSAVAMRRFLAAIFPSSGIVGQGDLRIHQTVTPSFAVNIDAGAAVVWGTEAPGPQGAYFLNNDAMIVAKANPVPAHASLNRIDLVVARQYDHDYSGASDDWAIEWVTGTASGSPVAPGLPANSLLLAQVAIAATTTALADAVITDKRVPTFPVRNTGLYHARLGRSAAYSMPSGGTNPVPFDTKGTDPDPMGMGNIASGYFLIPVDGWYRVTGILSFSSAPIAYAYVQVMAAGSTPEGGSRMLGSQGVAAGQYPTIGGTARMRFLAADHVTMTCGFPGATAFPVNTAAGVWMEIEYVGPRDW